MSSEVPEMVVRNNNSDRCSPNTHNLNGAVEESSHGWLLRADTMLFLLNLLLLAIPTNALLASVRTLAGSTTYGSTNGIGTNARLYYPAQGDISPDGTLALVTDYYNHMIRQIVISTALVTTLAGKSTGSANGVGTTAGFKLPTGVTFSIDGTYALVVDANHMIRQLVLSTAMVTTIAGTTTAGSINGVGTNARFNIPFALAFSPDGSIAIIADSSNHLIRVLIVSTASVSTLAGTTSSGTSNGVGTLARFNRPTGVEFSSDGSSVLIADCSNQMIRKIILSTALVMTFAGSPTAASGAVNGLGTNARFNSPYDVRVSPQGDYALVAEETNNMIRYIDLSTSSVETLIGVAASGSVNGVGTNARVYGPNGVCISNSGDFVLIIDCFNHMVRIVNLLDAPTRAPTAQPTLVPTITPSTDPTYAHQLIQPMPHQLIQPMPHQLIQPMPHQLIQPMPHQLIQPMPHQLIQPMPHQLIQPMPHQLIQPMPIS
jgi:DNA-binding beta-propeller fold protein YncE